MIREMCTDLRSASFNVLRAERGHWLRGGGFDMDVSGR